MIGKYSDSLGEDLWEERQAQVRRDGDATGGQYRLGSVEEAVGGRTGSRVAGLSGALRKLRQCHGVLKSLTVGGL